MSDSIIRLAPGDRLEMKKPHPCGGKVFSVIRAGSDVHVLCEACGHHILLSRIKLEKGIRRKLGTGEDPSARS